MKPSVKKTLVAVGILAILAMVAVTAVLLLRKGDTPSVPSGEEPEAETEAGYVYVPDEFAQVWFFPADGSFPAWTSPMPFVNPMGGEETYAGIEIRERYYHTFEYADERSTLIKRSVYGDTWSMRIAFDDKKTWEENRQFVFDIEHYIRDRNGTVMGYFEDSIVFVITDGEGIRWWAEAALYYEEILLHVVRQDDIKVGQTLVIRTEDYQEGVVRFASYNPGDEYQSILLEFDRGEVSFDIYTDNNYGSYRRSYRTSDTVHEGLGTRFYFDSIMYDPGFSNWEVTWYDAEVTKEIRITLQKTGSIPVIRYGEPLGAIKVSSEHVAGMDAYPTGGHNLNMEHPEFSYDDFYLDRTSDGDYILFVPAGLWDVRLYPQGNSLVSHYETLMVPVHSGEVTLVEIPYSISNAQKAGVETYQERGIRIGSVREDLSSNRATFQFTLLDQNTRDILPDPTNTVVMESGVNTRILSIEHVKTPPGVVLLLDSSGSMRGQMQAALDAAASFVNGLPDQAVIRIVDFDHVIRVLPGSDKQEALRNLSSITVGGDTALYEAIRTGLDLLLWEDRPVLVVFTDGENDVKCADGLTLEETLEMVHDADTPLYTIGFGRGHDGATLEKLAKTSDGQYFRADDGEALRKVFEAVNERLGSTYEATYERPREASIGDVPVVSFVIDTSGSMLTDDEVHGSRIHNVKNLLREFVLGLPDEVLMQLTEFDFDIKIVQALTTDKMRMLRGLGRLEADGGTEIIGSVQASYQTLKEIPSTKKALIYITDAALETTRDGNDFFREMLSEMKHNEISILWVGLGIEEEEEDFRLAAELSGGEYIVTEDLELLSRTFTELLREVAESPKSGLSNLFIGIEKTTDMGARESFSVSKLVELSPVKKGDEILVAETIRYEEGRSLRQYDWYTAAHLTGSGQPAQDTIISKRMEIYKQGSNEAMAIRTDELFFLKKLNGLDAPSNYRFMAVTMELENIMEAREVTVYPDGSSHPSSWLTGGAKGEVKIMKIPYMIPDFTSHFSLTYNREGAHPASLATWITEKSLPFPGDSAITVQPGESRSGTMVFLVPDEPAEQLSLHFYDIHYGHIHIPLVGEMKPGMVQVDVLPKQEPSRLSDAFTLAITGQSHHHILPGTGQGEDAILPGDGTVFRVVEGTFTSQVQALLNVDPFERFSLRIPTASGDFHLPINPATGLLPGGFAVPRMISPGSFNRVFWLFEIPEVLQGNASWIFVDLRGEGINVPVATGSQWVGGLDRRYASEYVDLTVNHLVWITDGFNQYSGEYVIADITVHDKGDGVSSAGIASLFSVVSDQYFEEAEEESDDGSGLYEETGSGGLAGFGQWGGKSTENRLGPYRLTEELILGFTDDSVVYDGASRRGILLFLVPHSEEGRNWYLFSEAFKDLKMPVEKGTYAKGLLAEKTWLVTDDTFAANLNAAIGKAVERYRLNHPDQAGQLAHGNIALGEEALDKQDVPVPAISTHGAEIIRGIRTVEDLVAYMKTLRNLPGPSSYGPFQHSLSKEALATQGFGMEQDFANMAMEVLSRLGYQPKPRIVKVTERGRQELSKMSGVPDIPSDYLPAVSFLDDENRSRILVIPFMEDLEVLKRLVYMDYSHTYIDRSPNTMRLEVNAYGHLTDKGAVEHIGDISDALGGDTEGGPVPTSQWLFNQEIPLDALSLDAIDIGVARDGNRARIYLVTPDGERFGDQYVELDRMTVNRLELVFSLPDQNDLVHVVRLEEGMGIEGVFFTVSVNAPDLSAAAAARLQEAAEGVHGKADKPSELSALRWFGRSLIAEFITLQTHHDRQLLKGMGLVAGRIQKPRVLVVTQTAGKNLRTSISLLQVHEQLHAGTEENQKTFNLMSGIYASSLEGLVLPGAACSLEEVWQQAPEGTRLVFLDYIGSDTREDLERAGMPEDVIRRFSESSTMVLMTDRPSLIDGRRRWAWFEIDPATYEMIAVLDTLEKGAFVEGTVIDTVKSAGQYAVGAFKGVETAVWSVAAFSLELDDYGEILKAAKALALGIADNFGFNMGPLGASIGGKPSVSQALGPVTFSFDGSAGASQNILGFTEGYKAGVEYYFSHAE